MSELQLSSLAKALEADRTAFRVFADAIPNFVWLVDEGGHIVYLNREMLAYAGFSDELTYADRFASLVHADDVDRIFREWSEALSTGVPFETEFRLRRASDDTYRWFLSRAVPVRDVDGRLTYWIGTSTDIDAQKRATENLSFLMDASESIAAAETIDQVCVKFADIAAQRFGDWCFVVLADSTSKYKVWAVAHRDPDRVRHVEQFLDRYPIGEDGGLDTMLRAGGPTLFPSISDEMLQQAARDKDHLQLMRDMQLYSAIVAPLQHAGELFGGIIMYAAESRRQFDPADVNVLKMLAQRAAARMYAMRLLSEEQAARRRLQFIGRAAQAAYESFDTITAFGNLAQVIVSEIGDMAGIFRLEEDRAARVVGAAHRDPELDDIARSLVGVRVLQTEAEKRFVESLRARKPRAGTHFAPGTIENTVWPYLADEIAALRPRGLVTVPLHSRGKVHGAIVVYYTQNGRSFKPDDVEILVEIGRHASVALENADVFERERRMSETLQDSLLPPSLPRVDGLSFDAVYLPSATEAQVGGDWYDAYQLEDGTTVISAGDVTGRGAEAAVIMGKVRHLLAIAPSYERDPARILDTVETVLARRYPDVIVTAFLGFISPDRSGITYANAGHPPPVLRRSTGIEELHAEGLPIGLRRETAPSASRTTDLRDARMLVVYTDGLTESRHDILGGEQQLHDVVSQEAVLHSHRPARFIEESCLGNAATDDVAILTISFEPGIRWSFDAENAKAAQDARGEFVAYLRRHGVDGMSIETAELVFGELVGNVVRHAPGAIDIDVEWSSGSPLLHVLDRGPAFTPPSHLPDDMLSESGRGLFIIRELSRSMRVEHVPGYGNHVCVELPVFSVNE